MNILRIMFIYLATIAGALAAPGAHGPNGEHLDAPAGIPIGASAMSRIDAFTESFELVGHLHEGELSILIDRYETNEPVLNGLLEVDYNGVVAQATFHADHGDYAIDNEELLQALAKPGEHPLVFMLTVGDESDLLEGVLKVTGDSHVQDRSQSYTGTLKTWAAGGIVLFLLLLALAVFMLRRRQLKTGA